MKDGFKTSEGILTAATVGLIFVMAQDSATHWGFALAASIVVAAYSIARGLAK